MKIIKLFFNWIFPCMFAFCFINSAVTLWFLFFYLLWVSYFAAIILRWYLDSLFLIFLFFSNIYTREYIFLSITLADVFHKYWYYVFINFQLIFFLIFILISLTHSLYRSVLLIFKHLGTWKYFEWLVCSFSLRWSDNIFLIISVFTLTNICFMVQHMSNVSRAFVKNIHSADVKYGILW